EIDTLNEKYQAQASIEARWPIELNELQLNPTNDDHTRLEKGQRIELPNYAEAHWHPKLYIENSFSELKEQITYSAKKLTYDNKIYVFETREVQGMFWEKLELQHFPSDVQDLSISIASRLFIDTVILASDLKYPSVVNRKVFTDEQKWSLYEHINTKQTFFNKFIFKSKEEEDEEEDDEEEDDEEETKKYCDEANDEHSQDQKHSILTVTCHAARRSSYFYWNAYCLIFLITILSFTAFAIPPHLMANRIQISCTLILTSVTFRWTVNKSCPTISYLTTMDKYGILCLFFLIVECFWHATIGFLIFKNNIPTVTPSIWFTQLDGYAFYTAISIYVIIHIAFVSWLVLVPFKLRKHMKAQSDKYCSLLKEDRANKKKSFAKKSSKRHSGYIHVPVNNQLEI
ncbi:unnamed protein product, partial [Rotaria magnacalcarata]